MKHLALFSLLATAIGALALELTAVDAEAQGGPMAIPVEIHTVKQTLCGAGSGGGGACTAFDTSATCYLTHTGTVWTCTDTRGNVF